VRGALSWIGSEENLAEIDFPLTRWLACRLLQKVLFHLRGCLVLRIAASTWKAPAHVGLYPSACYVGNRPMFRRMYLNMRPVLVRHVHVHVQLHAHMAARVRARARSLSLSRTHVRSNSWMRGCLNIAAALYDRAWNLLPVRVGGFARCGLRGRSKTDRSGSWTGTAATYDFTLPSTKIARRAHLLKHARELWLARLIRF